MEAAAIIADVVLTALLAGCVLFVGRRVGDRLSRTETAVAVLGGQVTQWLDADHRRVVQEYAWRQIAERDTVDLRAAIDGLGARMDDLGVKVEKGIWAAGWQGYRANLVDSRTDVPAVTAGELFRHG